jgi:hypothetical protein
MMVPIKYTTISQKFSTPHIARIGSLIEPNRQPVLAIRQKATLTIGQNALVR